MGRTGKWARHTKPNDLDKVRPPLRAVGSAGQIKFRTQTEILYSLVQNGEIVRTHKHSPCMVFQPNLSCNIATLINVFWPKLLKWQYFVTQCYITQNYGHGRVFGCLGIQRTGICILASLRVYLGWISNFSLQGKKFDRKGKFSDRSYMDFGITLYF